MSTAPQRCRCAKQTFELMRSAMYKLEDRADGQLSSKVYAADEVFARLDHPVSRLHQGVYQSLVTVGSSLRGATNAGSP